MQNTDFSRYIQNRNLPPSDRQDNWPVDEQKSVTRRNRKIIFALVLTVTAFALGFIAGIPVGKIKQIEKSIISHPDDERPEYSSAPEYSNIVETPTQENSQEESRELLTDSTAVSSTQSFVNRSEEARFLIKVGTFANKEAERLANRLNQLSVLQARSPERCRNVTEQRAERGLVFRFAVDKAPKQKNVLVGCFHTAKEAQGALQAILSSNIPGVMSAQLYEIEE